MSAEHMTSQNDKPVAELDSICQRLGLPCDCWPPSHYQLLGLPEGESDRTRIEAAVHVQMNKIRCYQLSHPEQATVVMNRVAEAYSCLCDVNSKSEYDRSRGLEPKGLTEPGKTAAPKKSMDDTVTDGIRTVVDWDDSTAPPVRASQDSEEEPTTLDDSSTVILPPSKKESNFREDKTEEIIVPPQTADSTQTPPEPAKTKDPEKAYPQKSNPGDRGLGTRKKLYERVVLTRQLYFAWQKVGRYAAQPKKAFSRTAEFRDMVRRLEEVESLLVEFPPILGHPGTPGYRISILARDEDPITAFKEMDLSERENMAKEWWSSYHLIKDHLNFLRHEIRERKKEGMVKKLFRPIRSLVSDYSGWVIFLLLGSFLLAACIVLMVNIG